MAIICHLLGPEGPGASNLPNRADCDIRSSDLIVQIFVLKHTLTALLGEYIFSYNTDNKNPFTCSYPDYNCVRLVMETLNTKMINFHWQDQANDNRSRPEQDVKRLR